MVKTVGLFPTIGLNVPIAILLPCFRSPAGDRALPGVTVPPPEGYAMGAPHVPRRHCLPAILSQCLCSPAPCQVSRALGSLDPSLAQG